MVPVQRDKLMNGFGRVGCRPAPFQAIQWERGLHMTVRGEWQKPPLANVSCCKLELMIKARVTNHVYLSLLHLVVSGPSKSSTIPHFFRKP